MHLIREEETKKEGGITHGGVEQFIVVLGGPKGEAYSVYVQMEEKLHLGIEKIGPHHEFTYVYLYAIRLLTVSFRALLYSAESSDAMVSKVIDHFEWLNGEGRTHVDTYVSSIHTKLTLTLTFLGQPLARVKFLNNDESPVAEDEEDDHDAQAYGDDGSKYVQFEGRGEDGSSYVIKYNGSQQDVIVRSPYEHRLSAHMREPEKKGKTLPLHIHTQVSVTKLVFSFVTLNRLFQIFIVSDAGHVGELFRCRRAGSRGRSTACDRGSNEDAKHPQG